MKNRLIFVYTAMYLIAETSTFAEKSVPGFVVSLMDFFNTDQCIIVSDNLHAALFSAVSNLKLIAKESVFVTYMTSPQLLEHIDTGNIPIAEIMIIFMITDESYLKKTTTNIRDKISDYRKMALFKWVLILPLNVSLPTEKDAYIPYDCQFLVVSPSTTDYEIFEIYQIKHLSVMMVSFFGRWNEKNKLSVSGASFYERRKDMKGEVMVMETSKDARCLYPMECLQIDLWLDMGRVMNFSTTFMSKVEISTTNKHITPDAFQDLVLLNTPDIDNRYVVAPILTTKLHLYIRTTTDKKDGMSSYLKPFQWHLWAAIIIWLVISTTVTTALAWTVRKKISADNYDMVDQIFSALSALCAQGHFYGPKINSFRLARLVTLAVPAVIIPAYSASVISYLTIKTPKIPFTDLASFAKDGTYTLVPINHSFTRSYFENPRTPLIQTIRDKYLLPVDELPNIHAEAADMLCAQDDIAVLGFNYKIIRSPSECSILLLSKDIFSLGTGVELAFGSPFQRPFNKLLVKFRSSGIIHRSHIQLYRGNILKMESPDRESIPLLKTLPILSLLLFGIIASLMILLLEQSTFCHC